MLDGSVVDTDDDDCEDNDQGIPYPASKIGCHRKREAHKHNIVPKSREGESGADCEETEETEQSSRRQQTKRREIAQKGKNARSGASREVNNTAQFVAT